MEEPVPGADDIPLDEEFFVAPIWLETIDSLGGPPSDDDYGQVVFDGKITPANSRFFYCAKKA